jgi:hypothetical protein
MHPPEMYEALAKLHPLRRMGEVQEAIKTNSRIFGSRPDRFTDAV